MKSIIVGKVYANWCGHCQHLAPQWDLLKEKPELASVEFVEIEESEKPVKLPLLEKRVGQSVHVDGYPTIFKYQHGGKIEYYKGPRVADEMKNWVLQKAPTVVGGRRGRRQRKTQKRKTKK